MSLSAPKLTVRLGLFVALVSASGAVPAHAAAASGPIVVASVATKDGTLIGPMRVRAAQAHVKVGRRRCTVAAGTPLAALIALKAKASAPAIGALRLADRGHCGTRAAASARLSVVGIGADQARGRDGWAYAVGSKLSATHAADPAGPFGRGALDANAEVAWRWCTGAAAKGCGDVLTIAGLFTDDTTPGDASAGVDIGVTVKLRHRGSSQVPPAGTDVVVITPSGLRIDGATTSGDGLFKLHAAAAPPGGSRVVATGPAGVAPSGRLWPSLAPLPVS